MMTLRWVFLVCSVIIPGGIHDIICATRRTTPDAITLSINRIQTEDTTPNTTPNAIFITSLENSLSFIIIFPRRFHRIPVFTTAITIPFLSCVINTLSIDSNAECILRDHEKNNTKIKGGSHPHIVIFKYPVCLDQRLNTTDIHVPDSIHSSSPARPPCA